MNDFEEIVRRLDDYRTSVSELCLYFKYRMDFANFLILTDNLELAYGLIKKLNEKHIFTNYIVLYDGDDFEPSISLPDYLKDCNVKIRKIEKESSYCVDSTNCDYLCEPIKYYILDNGKEIFPCNYKYETIIRKNKVTLFKGSSASGGNSYFFDKVEVCSIDFSGNSRKRKA